MQTKTNRYPDYRFPREIISHGVWLYHRFALSLRDVEELLAMRGVLATYETVRQWCRKFGPGYASKLKRRQGQLGDIWHLGEVFVRVRGERHYLWRAVDQDGDVLDILIQRHRNAHAAKRFFRELIKGQERTPLELVTDKLKSYGAARVSVMSSVKHNTARYANNRAEVSHQPTRARERQMRGFKAPGHALRLLSVHGVIQNFFRPGRHQLSPEHYRLLRARSFEAWRVATGT
jgi:putative transposase